MSIQLSMYWQSADQLEWYWTGDSDVYSGALEELIAQRQQKNMESCVVRLFLPASWFATVDVRLPANARRLTPQIMKFAAEEYLAQDIDSVHLTLKERMPSGQALLEATDLSRFSQILQTLRSRQFFVTEAYNAQRFSLHEAQTDDVMLQVMGDQVSLSASGNLFNVHVRGFTQWFELWANQNDLPDDASISIVSDTAEGPAKALVTEFEAAGYTVSWTVEAEKVLVDWNEQADRGKKAGNLITGQFAQSSGSKNTQIWAPAAVAVFATLILWSTISIMHNQRTIQKTEQTWNASEQVFLQVFGQDKRIQRPLMVREMRSLVANSGATDGASELNGLSFLRDISSASSSFVLEDFRFNKARNEAFFTLTQPVSAEGDAYELFEALKTDLSGKQYQVEYSANQEKDVFKARFKAVYGGNG